MPNESRLITKFEIGDTVQIENEESNTKFVVVGILLRGGEEKADYTPCYLITSYGIAPDLDNRYYYGSQLVGVTSTYLLN